MEEKDTFLTDFCFFSVSLPPIRKQRNAVIVACASEILLGAEVGKAENSKEI